MTAAWTQDLLIYLVVTLYTADEAGAVDIVVDVCDKPMLTAFGDVIEVRKYALSTLSIYGIVVFIRY